MNTKSNTMRIDLIPDINEVPLSDRPKPKFIQNGTAPATPDQNAPATETAARTRSLADGYGELFHNIYDAAIITDLHGRIRDVNHRATLAFGYSPVQFSRLTLDKLIAGADTDVIRTLFENLKRECFTLMQANCFRADGTNFPAEVSVSQIKLSTPHLCFLVRDETLRQNASEMLRTEHNALQNAADAIVVIDLEANIEYANPATAQIWGYNSPSEFIGKSLDTLLFNEGDSRAIINSLSGENYCTGGEAIAKRKNDESFRVEIRAACNRNSEGHFIGAVISLSDLTERDRVVTAEKNAALLRGMAQQALDLHKAVAVNISEVQTFLSALAEKPDLLPDEALRAKLSEAIGSMEGLSSLAQDSVDMLTTSLQQTDPASDTPTSLS